MAKRPRSREALARAQADPAAALAAQRQQGWRARPGMAPWPVIAPFDWAADPFADQNWRFQLNAWRPLDAYITAYEADPQESRLDEAIALMRDWDAFDLAHPELDALLWNDMGSGLRAAKLAFFLQQPGLRTPDRKAARAALAALGRRHLARLRTPGFVSLSNHGLFQAHGLHVLARALKKVPEAQGAEAHVAEMFGAMIKAQFGAEGVHLEHSPGYHLFALKILRKLKRTGLYRSAPVVSETLALGQANQPWFVFPNGDQSAIGDSERRQVRNDAPPTGETPVLHRLFKEAGYAVVRSEAATPAAKASMLLVTGAHHSAMHKHADELSFELWEKGRFVFVDAGKYSYSDGLWRRYVQSARAHNTVDLIAEREDNGLGLLTPAGGVLTALEPAPWGFRIDGGVRRERWGVSHERTFLYRPGRWLVLVDRVQSRHKRAFTSWLHLAPDLEARPVRDGWRFAGGRVRVHGPADGRFILERGREAEPVQGWMATGYHLKTPNDALGFRWTGRGGTVVTVCRLGLGPTPRVARSGGRVVVRWGWRSLLKAPLP